VPDELVMELDQGWELSRAEAGGDPIPAAVPGTAAGALRDAGLWAPGDPLDFDAEDWWFRTRFARPAGDGGQILLELDGIATVAEVLLNGETLFESESMFARHSVDVTARIADENELVIHCKALAPLLRERRRPRARWRTRVVAEQNLRFFRTAMLGRAPGFAPGPAAVGPWRPVRLRVRNGFALDAVRLRSALEGDLGIVDVSAEVRDLGSSPDSIELQLSGPTGTHQAVLALEDGRVAGRVEVPDAVKWWPHTHGDPQLYEASLVAGDRTIPAGRIGFRSIAAGAAGHDIEADGLDLHVNGVRVFARGAVWTPVDAVGLAAPHDELRDALATMRDGGMNVVRVVGTGAYESHAFHELCDELGLLVWQDLMFANFDYPFADDAFRATVEAEVAATLAELARHPSLAVLCGNSEVEQQAAMLGLEPDGVRGEVFGEMIPHAIADAGIDAAYVPSAPCGGSLAFRTNRGVANYFGVGAYLRPLADARAADVRFASECLAFSNVPDEAGVERVFGDGPPAPGHHPRWKAGVPRDAGAGWDFEDVRDHYLRELYGLDPVELRWSDPERYLELGRAVTGEVMAEVFGEWRRAGSRCGGAIVLWQRDLVAGPGWGLVDELGHPKAAYHHLRRALAPVSVWTTDEGLNGVNAHVANDHPEPLAATLRVAVYRGEHRLEEAIEELELAPHETVERELEALLGRFFDLSWAYRFGPPAQDLVVVSLENVEREPLSQAFRFPAGRPLAPVSAADLGLTATLAGEADPQLRIAAKGFAYGVRIHAPGFAPSDDAFSIEPGGQRILSLSPHEPGAAPGEVAITALHLSGRVRAATDAA
jgi:beta-mannosidase